MTARARVSRQCVISRELAGPKNNLNRVIRKGNWLIFQCHERVVSVPCLSLPDRVSRIVVLSNYSNQGEYCNSENLDEMRMAFRKEGLLDSRRH